jgi:hypothetical protein
MAVGSFGRRSVIYGGFFFRDRDANELKSHRLAIGMPRDGAIIFSDLIGKLDLIRVALAYQVPIA